MRFLVIGTGSIGKRHIRNLIAIGTSVASISAVDPREDRRKEIADLGISKIYSSFDAAMANNEFDAAIVCSPTSMHIEQGTLLAEKGVHILMEKPLSRDLTGIDEFEAAVEKNKTIVLIAYIFRFTSLIEKMKKLLDEAAIGRILSLRGEFSEYLPDWHPYEDYRSFYMAKKSMGGGSILDQCHIMDLVHYLAGDFDSVFCVNEKVSNLEIEADDIAEMIIRMKSGAIASVHTDIYGRGHRKDLEIKGTKGNLTWDFYGNKLSWYDTEKEHTTVFDGKPKDFNMFYIRELEHFIACCDGKELPLADLKVGIDTMNLILAAELSQQTGAMVKVNS